MKIKIIRLPTFFQHWDINSSELSCSLLPPLGTALITGYLSRRGFRIWQDDLNIKIFYERRYRGFAFDQKPFFDEARINNYCDGNPDSGLDRQFAGLEKRCRIKGFDVVLLSLQESLRNKSNILFARAFAHYIKKKYQPFVLVGGFGVAVRLFYMEHDSPDVDFYVASAGERALEILLKAKEQKKDLCCLEGLHYQHKNRVVSSDYAQIEKPVFKGLPMAYYRYKGTHSEYDQEVKGLINEFHSSATMVLPFGFIKGCPHKCIFCCESNGKLDFIMGHQEVAGMLKELQSRHNPTGFFFLNNEINVSSQYAENLCDSIIKARLKIRWSDCARADFATKENLLKMKEAGCIRLIFGIETGSRMMLEYIRKGVSPEQLEQAIRWANELGIWTGIEVICGLPHEKEEDIEETIRFLQRNRRFISRFYFNTFDLRGGSLLFHEPEKHGIKNIFDVNEAVSYEERKYSKNFTQFGFDEINGLAWKEKQKQILHSYDRVVEALGGYEGFPTLEEEHFLFFMYKKFGHDIEKIQRIFRRVAQEKGKYRDYLRTRQDSV